MGDKYLRQPTRRTCLVITAWEVHSLPAPPSATRLVALARGFVYAFATARPSHSSNVVVGGWVACSPGVHWGAGHEARRDGALEPRDPGWNRLEIHKEATCARGSDLARKPRRAAGRAMNSEARGARERGSGGEGVGAVTAPKIMMGSRSIGMTLMATYVRRERARERLTPPTGTAALAFWDKKGTPSLPFGIRREHPPSLLRLQGKHPPSLLISQGNEGGWSAPITGSKHLFGREGGFAAQAALHPTQSQQTLEAS